jgi:hypothetical protein
MASAPALCATERKTAATMIASSAANNRDEVWNQVNWDRQIRKSDQISNRTPHAIERSVANR